MFSFTSERPDNAGDVNLKAGYKNKMDGKRNVEKVRGEIETEFEGRVVVEKTTRLKFLECSVFHKVGGDVYICRTTK